MTYYILVNETVVSEPDLMKWGTWFSDISNRKVEYNEVGTVQISTVFLGIDHSFGGVNQFYLRQWCLVAIMMAIRKDTVQFKKLKKVT